MTKEPVKSLVIGISSRALFDLGEANDIYEKKGLKAYAYHQKKYAETVLKPGSGFPLIRAMLRLNEKVKDGRPAEVVIMSKNSPATSLRLFNSIDHYELDIKRASLSGGTALAPYLKAFGVDLFLSADADDVRAAIHSGHAAALIYEHPAYPDEQIDQIRIAFDGDAVLFSDESERIYKEKGIEAFLKHEKQNARKPLPEGPFAKLLKTLSFLHASKDFSTPPVRLALVTARNMPAHERVIRTFLDWNVNIDEAHFMGGNNKTPILEAFKPHIFFDDQDKHAKGAATVAPTARVLFGVTDDPHDTIGSQSQLASPASVGKR